MKGTLLDSHVLLWLVADDTRLGPEAHQRLLTAPAFVSAATTWELTIKQSLGKVTLPTGFVEKIAAAGLTALPVTLAHSVAINEVEVPHKDPFDRLLLATAEIEGLKFLTADRVLLALGRPDVVDARE